MSLLFLVIVGYSAYLQVRGQGEGTPDYGGTYAEGIAGGVLNLNPLLSTFNEADQDLVSLIFSGLTRLNGRGEVVPELAQRWEVSADGRQYTFFLRPEVRWHDGMPLTAEDVVLTIRALQDPQFPGFSGLAELWKSLRIEALDDATLRFTLPESFAPFLTYTTLGILPRSFLQKVSLAKMRESPFNINPIGTGPFRLRSAAADVFVLEANPDYFRGRPYLDQIQARFFRDEPSVLAALENSSLQGSLFRPALAAKAAANLERQAQLRLYRVPASRYTVIFLNTGRPLFKDATLRKALLLALDRQRIVDRFVGGQGLVAGSPVVPKTWGYEPDIAPVSYSPEGAAKLLEELGWKKGPDGIREKDGKRLSFSLVTNSDEYDDSRVPVTEEVARQWHQVGIEAKLSSSGWVGLLESYLKPRRFDAVLSGLDVGYDPDPYPAWHSSQIGEDGFNYAAYANPQVDAVLEQARQTADPEERKRLYARFQRTFAEEVPSLLLYYPLYTYAVDKRVKGIRLGVLFEPSSRFENVTEWFLHTKPLG